MRGGVGRMRGSRFARPTGKTSAVFAAGVSFLGMTASGLILLLQPRGILGSRLAFSFLEIDSAAWSRIHIVFALLFLVSGTWHIALHLAVIRTILFGSKGHHGGHLPEAVAVLVVATLLLGTALLDIPPSSWIIDLNRSASHAIWRP